MTSRAKNDPMLSRFPIEIGLRLDVLDEEGIWNTGHVVDVDAKSKDGLIEVQYDGWGTEYNEWIAVDSNRVAPLHMFTIVKKCWAKLRKWPWWPAFTILRAPTSDVAVQSLELETKIYVEFFDEFDEHKRSRCWMQRKDVVSFNDEFDMRASKNLGKQFVKHVEGTQRAAASDSPLLFTGKGTLAIEFSSKFPLAIEIQRARIGEEQWYQAYKAFSDRYRELYGYTNSSKVALTGGSRGRNDASDDDVEILDHAAAADVDEDEDGNDSQELDESEVLRKRASGRKAARKSTSGRATAKRGATTSRTTGPLATKRARKTTSTAARSSSRTAAVPTRQSTRPRRQKGF